MADATFELLKVFQANNKALPGDLTRPFLADPVRTCPLPPLFPAAASRSPLLVAGPLCTRAAVAERSATEAWALLRARPCADVIIMFRDGVSEGQFRPVLTTEFQGIKAVRSTSLSPSSS